MNHLNSTTSEEGILTNAKSDFTGRSKNHKVTAHNAILDQNIKQKPFTSVFVVSQQIDHLQQTLRYNDQSEKTIGPNDFENQFSFPKGKVHSAFKEAESFDNEP